MESTVIYGIDIFFNIYIESTVIHGINIFSNKSHGVAQLHHVVGIVW